MQQSPITRVAWWNLAIHQSCGVDGGLLSNDSDHQVLEQRTREWQSLAARLQDENVASIVEVHDLLLRTRSLTKWRLPVVDANERACAALKGFVDRNQQVKHFSCCPVIENSMRGLLAKWLPPVSDYPNPRFGPGAVAEHLSQWRRRALLARIGDYVANPFVTHEHPDDLVGHQTSRLCAVPKDWNKDRLITVEPVVATLLQQSARAYLYTSFLAGNPPRVWKNFWKDMPDTQRARALASSASGRLATIDLSDASDRISYDLVQRVMPGHVMAWLDVARTPYFQFDGETQCLHIYGGMGNATTFLVETLIFRAYVEAVGRAYGITPMCTVFGDDIICNSELFDRGLLERDDCPFFKVNRVKSFGSRSSFRESCGVFAYKGIDVSAPKIAVTDNLSVADLWRRLSKSSFASEQRLAMEIAMTRELKNLPFLIDGLAAISEPGLEYDALPPERWNSSLQRLEYLVPMPVSVNKYKAASKQWMLDACLLGQGTTITSNRRGRRLPFFFLPTDRTKIVNKWVAPTEGSDRMI